MFSELKRKAEEGKESGKMGWRGNCVEQESVRRLFSIPNILHHEEKPISKDPLTLITLIP